MYKKYKSFLMLHSEEEIECIPTETDARSRNGLDLSGSDRKSET